MTTPRPSTLDAPSRRRFTVDNAQNGVLIMIVLSVGLMAGAASFHHVHDWTLDHSPTDTPDWFGWANAVITELIPTAALIEIGRRRRKNHTAKVGYPMFLLVAAVGISLTAQLAIAEASLFGWMVSALPALAFFALSKLVFSVTAHRPTDDQVAATTPATSPATSSDTTRVEVSPAAASTTRATPRKRTPAKKTSPKTPAKKTTPPAAPKPVPAAPATVPALAPATPSDTEIPVQLLSSARAIAISHRDSHDEPINKNQLAVRLRIPTATADDILTYLENHPVTPATTRPHNGATIGATA
jgi:hypothetical protein